MPTTRVIWIPWQAGGCDCDFFEGSKQWQEARLDKNFIIVSYNPGTVSSVISNLATGDCKIYLRGHGTPGDPSVKPTNTFNNPNALHIRDSIDRLCEMGLKPGFRGTIKFYSCYSAVQGVDRQRGVASMQGKWALGKFRFGPKVATQKWVNLPRPEGTWDPLAKRGADYMRSLGFVHCTYHGYRGLCSREMEADEGESSAHKHVQPMAFRNVGDSTMSADGDRGRASSLRVEF